MLRKPFGIFRHVERRETNATKGDGGFIVNVYKIMVTRVVFLWVTVWTHESDWT